MSSIKLHRFIENHFNAIKWNNNKIYTMVIIIVLLLEIDEHFMKYYFNKNRNDTNTDYILTYCCTRYIIYMLGFLIIMFGHPL